MGADNNAIRTHLYLGLAWQLRCVQTNGYQYEWGTMEKQVDDNHLPRKEKKRVWKVHGEYVLFLFFYQGLMFLSCLYNSDTKSETSIVQTRISRKFMQPKRHKGWRMPALLIPNVSWGPFLESPENFAGPKAIPETPTPLSCKAGLLTCCKGHTNWQIAGSDMELFYGETTELDYF